MVSRSACSGSVLGSCGQFLVAVALSMGSLGCGTKDQPPPTAEEAAQQPPLEAPKGPENSKQSALPD